MGILSCIAFTPLLGAGLLLLAPKERKTLTRSLAVLFSAAPLALGLWLWRRFDPSAGALQFLEKRDWIPFFNIHYSLGVDGLSLPLVLLTGLLFLIAVVASFGIAERVKEYFFWFLLLETGVLGVFLSLDFFLFYVFWEMTLVPMYFLIGQWGGPRRQYAAVKFILYMLAGSVFMLLGILALYLNSDPRTFDMVALAGQSGAFSPRFQMLAFAALYLGFAVKIPAFPFHTWLPLAHVEAPAPVSAILAGVLLKMGVYGLLRVAFPVLPGAALWFLGPLAAIACVNIVYGAVCALAQKDIKRMIAYSSISHMGFCLLGLAAVTGTNPMAGLSGVMLQMLAHGVITGSLFLLVGVLYDRTHTRDMDALGGLASRAPLLTGFMVVQCMASLGLPGLAGFLAEFLCFLGAFGQPAFRLWAGLALLGVLITAAFFLKLLKNVFMGPADARWENLKDMTPREILTTAPLVFLTVLLGVFPRLVLDVMHSTLAGLIDKVAK